ncbi:hypothetical protein JEQ12_012458 [Ovis aries]|uniref:Uncharacterized protein n=1 Tax=Ovis aries TaxID=9940 RepID=A0A835ZPQ9_SHEEP|nr:hypothetical protein JEQ12_012458 [Ovis aries]
MSGAGPDARPKMTTRRRQASLLQMACSLQGVSRRQGTDLHPSLIDAAASSPSHSDSNLHSFSHRLHSFAGSTMYGLGEDPPTPPVVWLHWVFISARLTEISQS